MELREYIKFRVTGSKDLISESIENVQSLVLGGDIEIKRAESGHVSEEFYYDGLLFLPEKISLPLAKGIVINEYQPVNFGSYSFVSRSVPEEDEHNIRQFIRLISGLAPTDIVDKKVEYVHRGMLSLRKGYTARGIIKGAIDDVLNQSDMLKNNPYSITIEREEFDYWRKAA